MKTLARRVVAAAVSFVGISMGQQSTPVPNSAAAGSSIVEPHPNYFSSVNEACSSRKAFESDHEFARFVGPISNPVFSKDPRSNTEVRTLFINNWIPNGHGLFAGGGNYQVVATQIRVALNERLSIIADKDGYGFFHPGGADGADGWLNIAAGLKYVFIRDVENQFIVSGGMLYELPTGEANVFQNQGDGIITAFVAAGKEIDCDTHLLATIGESFPIDNQFSSGYFYANLHLDRRVMDKFYPLVELNWFHYVSGGNWGIPSTVGEADGHINIGTSGVSGNDLVTVAVGAKYKPSNHLEFGGVWETPISNRQDIMDQRLTFEMILRY